MNSAKIIKNNQNVTATEQDLDLINRLTRRKFSPNEIYTFSVVLCDNDIDRQHEKFSDECLEQLAKMYVGKTGILDHKPLSDNQTARIYSCKVEAVPGKQNRLKEPYKRLVAKAYMPKCSKNENLILEIDSGIKKEVSVGCTVDEKICSICKKNVKVEKCNHIKGHRYKTDGGYKICHLILNNPIDAYEWSFVAIPAQREAGVIKSFGKLFKGGENNVETVLKSLDSGESITLNAQDCTKIANLIKNLQVQAKCGEMYQEELKSEVVRLCGIAQPEIKTDLIKSIADKLEIEELKSLKSAFKSGLKSIISNAPQILPEISEKSDIQNSSFKI